MSSRSVTNKIVSYIESHPDQNLTLEKLAEELHYSRFYLARVFKADTGMTVRRYIRSRRLESAAAKLAETEQPVVEIALEAGYGSQQSFARAFRREYGCTPQEYRRTGVFLSGHSRRFLRRGAQGNLLLCSTHPVRRAGELSFLLGLCLRKAGLRHECDTVCGPPDRAGRAELRSLFPAACGSDYLSGRGSKRRINSPGGSVSAGFAVYDTMQYVRCDVSTICFGLAASFGAFLLAGGAKGKRLALPHAEIMIHQPAVHGEGVRGPASDIRIMSDHILKSRERLNRILAQNTGRTEAEVMAATERDHYLSAEEALEFGLIDRLIGEP